MLLHLEQPAIGKGEKEREEAARRWQEANEKAEKEPVDWNARWAEMQRQSEEEPPGIQTARGLGIDLVLIELCTHLSTLNTPRQLHRLPSRCPFVKVNIQTAMPELITPRYRPSVERQTKLYWSLRRSSAVRAAWRAKAGPRWARKIPSNSEPWLPHPPRTVSEIFFICDQIDGAISRSRAPRQTTSSST